MYPSSPAIHHVSMARRVPPHAYFAGSAVFHYLGPSFAVLLFARVAPLGVAWLRIASAAVVFALWKRSWRALPLLDREGRLLIVAFAAVLALMNACFYEAIDRLPLASVAAMEFIGPVVLALMGARRARNVVAVAAATAGVYLLTRVLVVDDPLGVLFAFANAALFALYILLAHRLSRRSTGGGVDGLALAMLVAVVFISPLGLVSAAPAFTEPVVLAAAIGVGICSSVIPYVFDQLAMAQLPRATYALFVALLPATATVIGIVVLRQIPTAIELAGIGLVVAAVAIHQPEPAGRAAPDAGSTAEAATVA